MSSENYFFLLLRFWQLVRTLTTKMASVIASFTHWIIRTIVLTLSSTGTDPLCNIQNQQAVRTAGFTIGQTLSRPFKVKWVGPNWTQLNKILLLMSSIYNWVFCLFTLSCFSLIWSAETTGWSRWSPHSTLPECPWAHQAQDSSQTSRSRSVVKECCWQKQEVFPNLISGTLFFSRSRVEI